MNKTDFNNIKSNKKFHASKKMGQNFLFNKNIQNKIVASANLEKNDCVLEIGPGMGALTGILLSYKIKLFAIELDKRLFEFLTNKFVSYNNFKITQGDALKLDWNKITEQNSNIKIVANLPYSISSLLILKIIANNNIAKSVVMVQKEMADRLCAKIGTKSYNVFSVLVQIFADVKYLFNVDKTNFKPQPKVMSTVVEIRPKKTPLLPITEIDRINNFLHLVFSSKRKTIINNLSTHFKKDYLVNILEQLNFDLRIRAEQLSPEELINLMNKLNYENKSI